jgi:hypothetical protein
LYTNNALSLTFSENTGKIHESNSKKCVEYESKLREALDELRSAREIIEILQKELSLYLPTSNACRNNPVSPKASSKPVSSTEWTQIPARGYSLNPNKNKNRETTANDQTMKIANQFSMLHNVETVNTVLQGLQEGGKKKNRPQRKSLMTLRIIIKLASKYPR